MVEFNLVLIILLAEAALLGLLGGLGVVCHARLRRAHPSADACGDGAEALLGRMLAETEAALQARHRVAGREQGTEILALRCRLRALAIEQRLAGRDAASGDYWEALYAGYADLAPPHAGARTCVGGPEGPAPAPAPADADDVPRQMHRLLEQQRQGLDQLSAALAVLVDDPHSQWEQEAAVQALRENGRELGRSLAVLEDQIRYLCHRLETLESRSAQPEPVRAAAGG